MAKGWSNLGNSRKYHYFEEGEVISLCRNWMFLKTTEFEEGLDDHPDNCAACKRKLNKINLAKNKPKLEVTK